VPIQKNQYTQQYNIVHSSIGTFCTQSQQLLLPAQGCVADPEQHQKPGACLPYHVARQGEIPRSRELWSTPGLYHQLCRGDWVS